MTEKTCVICLEESKDLLLRPCKCQYIFAHPECLMAMKGHRCNLCLQSFRGPRIYKPTQAPVKMLSIACLGGIQGKPVAGKIKSLPKKTTSIKVDTRAILKP